MKKSKFLHYLAQCNGHVDLGFEQWIFKPGMAFGERQKWWDAEGERPHSHEGVDFRSFRAQGKEVLMDDKTLVPLMYDGQVERIFTDFLGQSILVSHQHYGGQVLYAIYAHVQSHSGIDGKKLKAGEIIASVAVQKKKSPVPPHLHISLLRVPAKLSSASIDWALLNKSQISLCDPLRLMTPYPPWRVYIVQCNDGTLYTGITTDVARRVKEHNSAKGGAKYTRARQPVQLVYCEPALSRAAAASREYRIKRMGLALKRKLITSGDVLPFNEMMA